jgi:hypothetical protein
VSLRAEIATFARIEDSSSKNAVSFSIGAHNESFSVAAMRVSNKDCLHSRSRAETQPQLNPRAPSKHWRLIFTSAAYRRAAAVESIGAIRVAPDDHFTALPVQTAVCSVRSVGALVMVVPVQLSMLGSYLPAVLTVYKSLPPQTINSRALAIASFRHQSIRAILRTLPLAFRSTKWDDLIVDVHEKTTTIEVLILCTPG